MNPLQAPPRPEDCVLPVPSTPAGVPILAPPVPMLPDAAQGNAPVAPPPPPQAHGVAGLPAGAHAVHDVPMLPPHLRAAPTPAAPSPVSDTAPAAPTLPAAVDPNPLTPTLPTAPVAAPAPGPPVVPVLPPDIASPENVPTADAPPTADVDVDVDADADVDVDQAEIAPIPALPARLAHVETVAAATTPVPPGVPVEPAPADMAPVLSVPDALAEVEIAPAQVAPAEAAPAAEIAPAEPVPVAPSLPLTEHACAPAEFTPAAPSLPGDPAEPEAVPIEPTPADLAPVEPTPVDLTPADLTPNGPALAPVVPVIDSVPVIDLAPSLLDAVADPAAFDPYSADDAPDATTSQLPAQLAPDPAFEIPSLPDFTPAKAPPPAEDAAWQPDGASWQPEPVAAGAKKATTKRSPVRSLLVTILLAALAAGAGAGAHLGYDMYLGDEVAQSASVPDEPTDLAAWRKVDPPAIRFTDTATTIVTDQGLREVTAHRDLVSGSRLVNVSETTLAGETNSFDVELSDEQALVRSVPDGPWVPTSLDEATALIGDEGLVEVFTVSDLFPAAALPFISVLASEEGELPLGTIRQRPAAGAAAAAATDTDTADAGVTNASRPIAAAPVDGVTPAAAEAPAQDAPSVDSDGSVDRTATVGVDRANMTPTQVWHFRVSVDTEAFRAAEGAAYQAWEGRLGRAAGGRFDVWVDANGVVRQLVIDADGTRLTQTLVSAAPTSRTFVTDPASTAPAPLPVEAAGS